MVEIFNKILIQDDMYKVYLLGLQNTLIIALGACVIGFIIGAVVTLLRIAPKNSLLIRVLERIAKLYVTIIRGTPVVLQLLIMYFVILKFMNGMWNGVLVAIITFGLNSGAYMSEILRAGLNAVDKGQMEAGRSLGFTWGQTIRRIVLPQGIKNALPTIFNEFIMLIKETSVVGYVAIIDLTKASRMVTSQTFEVFAPLFVVALIYLVLVLGLQQVHKVLERRMGQGD